MKVRRWIPAAMMLLLLSACANEAETMVEIETTVEAVTEPTTETKTEAATQSGTVTIPVEWLLHGSMDGSIDSMEGFEIITEDSTEDRTEVATEPATEAVTETTTELATETVAESPTEPVGTIVERTLATEEENMWNAYFLEQIEELLEAMKKKETSKVAGYMCSTEEAVKSWLDNLEVSSYEIGDCYRETYSYAYNQRTTTYFVVARIVVESEGNRIFRKGEGLYCFYYGLAGTAVSKICPLDTDYLKDYRIVKETCERYETFIGLDFEKGNAASLLEVPHIWIWLREFAYTNHPYINSMEELSLAIKDNLGLEDIPWDHSELMYNREGFLEEYERMPKGGSWHYYGVKEFTNSKCVLEYYADVAGFSVAKTVEYTYFKNENGTICITSVKTLEDTGFIESGDSV